MVLAPTELQESSCMQFAPEEVPSFDRHKLAPLEIALEIWLSIFSQLEAQDLLRCSQVCRGFHDVISSAAHLQYVIELFADGLEDTGHPCALSSSDRLSLLLARRRAWRNLDYTEKRSVRMSGRCHAYELVGGVFAKSSRIGEDVESSRRLIATHLPTRFGETQTLLHHDYKLPARDFAIDPSQDLIILVHLPFGEGPTWDIHLYIDTISTSKPHPDAKAQVLSHTVQNPIDLACIQIVNDVVGFWYVGFSPGLLIWNWKTGKTLVTSLGEISEDYCDFSFLSDSSFMLVNAQRAGSLDVYSFGDHTTAAETGIATKVASLRLPGLAPMVTCENMMIHTGPFLAKPDASSPFYTAPWSRILAISLIYRGGQGHGHRFCLFVHARTLLQYVEKWEAEVMRNPEADWSDKVQFWEDWGPRATRILPQYANFQWLRYVHGERVVLPPITIRDGLHPEQVIRVLDFRVHPKRAQDSANGTKKRSLMFGENTINKEGTVFARPVHSSLPCTVAERQGIEYRYSGYMIDEQRLVGLRASAFSEEDMGDLDVFTF